MGQQKNSTINLRKKRWRITIFTLALLLVGILSLIYSSSALADLIFNPALTTRHQKEIILRPNTTSPDDLTKTAQVITKRLDQLSTASPYQVIAYNDHLNVALPDTEQTPYIIDIITHIGEIEFIDGGSTSPPLGQQVNSNLSSNENPYPVIFSIKDVKEVIPPNTNTGQIFYRLNLKSSGAKPTTDFITQQPGNYICMVIDKEVVNCSSMYHQVGDSLDILPSLSSGNIVSLNELTIFIKSGSLPTPLTVEY